MFCCTGYLHPLYFADSNGIATTVITEGKLNVGVAVRSSGLWGHWGMGTGFGHGVVGHWYTNY